MASTRPPTLTRVAMVALVGPWLLAVPARAETTVWTQDDKYLALQMLIQMQLRAINAEGAGTNPDATTMFFRRLRPAVAGSLDRNWYGIIEIDFSAGFEGQDLKASVEDAYLEYMGFEDNRQSALQLGSLHHAFGREFKTPGSKLLTLENTFNGITWYGTPDLTLGAGFTRVMLDRHLSTEIVAGYMSINPRPDRIWFQSPQNQTSSNDNTGWVVTGRVDFWPFGEMPLVANHPAKLAFDPNDLARTPGVNLLISVAGFGWWNTNNNNQPTMTCPTQNDNVCPDGVANVDHVYGGEVSATVMGYGVSLETEYHRIHGALEDETFDGGLYQAGETNLNVLTASPGYMLTDTLELFGNFSLLTATKFPRTWYAGRVGINWFVHEHGIQISAEGTQNWNAFGTDDARQTVGRVQAQLAW